MKLQNLAILEQKLQDPTKIVYIISYPNSGRTWLRALLSRYKQYLLGIDDFHIKLHAYPSDAPYTPQYIFYHAGSGVVPHRALWQFWTATTRFPFDLSICAGSSLIFLLRSPKDVLVSNYYEMTARQKQFHGTISQFIRDERFGASRLIRFYNYLYEHGSMFSSTLSVQYDRLHKDTFEVMQKILQFSSAVVDESKLDEAIRFSHIDNMKELEMKDELVRPADPNARIDKRVRKVRTGKVGGFMEALSPEDIEYLEHRLRSELHSIYQGTSYSQWFTRSPSAV